MKSGAAETNEPSEMSNGATRSDFPSETLRETEDRAASILRSITDGFHVIDAGGRFKEFNLAAREMFAAQGLNADALIGKHIFDEVFPQVRDIPVGRAIQRTLAERVPTDAENLYEPWQRWYSVRNFPTADGGVATFFQDITERKRTAEALRRNEEQLRLVTDHAPVFLVHCDAEARYRFVNAAYAERFGLTPAQVVGRHLREVVGEKAYQNFRPHVEAVLRGERVEWEQEVPYEKLGNRCIRVSYVPEKDERGVVLGFFAVVQDITARKRAEEALQESEARFRNVSDNAPVMLWMTDRSGHCVHLNQRWYEFTGQTPQTGLGLGWLEVVHPDDLERSKSIFLAANARHQAFKLEYRLRRDDGVYRWAIDAATPRFGNNGEFLGFIGSVIDIDERKETEQALRQSEERYRSIFESIDEGFCIVEVIFDAAGKPVDYRFEQANPAFSRLTGLENVVGKTARELVPDLEAFWFETYGRVAMTGQAARFENESEPMQRWFDVHASRLGNADSRRVAIVFNNITERKQASEQLRRSAELLHVLIDRAPTGFYIVDADFRISHINADSQARAFRNVNPAVGRRLDDAMRVLWPEPLATEIIGIFRHTLDTGEPYKSPGLLSPRADLATIETYEWQLDRITMPDGRHAVVCYFYDTTRLREAEEETRKSRERFDIVRDGAQVGFWFCDLPFDELIWDNRVKEHFWLPPEAKVTIETFYERIHPQDRERTRAAIAASIANHTRYEVEYRTVSPSDRRAKWIRAIGRTFYNEQGQPIRFDGVTLDITEHKRDEEALHASRAQLAQANEQLASRAKQLDSLVQQRTAKLTETVGELEGFSYSITHDLRAPLRAVNGFSQILVEEYGAQLDDEGKRLLDRIQQSVIRMDRLIQDVLHYSRVLRMDLKLEPVNADRLVRGMLESYPDLQEPKASVRIEGHLPEVLANEAALMQCFSNLLNNAVKFVPPGRKPQITIRAVNRNPKVRFWVEDNGIGIEPQYLDRIFGLFQRLANDFDGTGVGLSIVRKAVERMGGSTGAESEPGKGSRFWFELSSAAVGQTNQGGLPEK